MGVIFKKMGFIIGIFVLFSFISPEKVEARNITFKVIAINPSKSKAQTTNIKKYLPKEITPNDVKELAGLELEYDTQRSLYYVYKLNVELQPAEIRTYAIEIDDIWVVAEDKLSQIEKQTSFILEQLKDTKYYPMAEQIANAIHKRLNEIGTSQSDESFSRQKHIGVYRQNLLVLEEIKEDMARMEKILVTAGGPASPEMLADTRITGDSPSKTMTWIVIFSIIVFTGLLAGVLFFTWQHQAHITRKDFLKAKESAFPDAPAAKEEPEEK